ncbi:hypothetical protein ACVIQY_005028 [Bradyrhizobium sp. USDA 3051]
MTAPPLPREVSRAYDAFPASIGKRLLWVRELIFAAAAAHEGIGRLTETLKWGEPAYLTEETGSGSTIRLGRLKDSAHAAILFNCKTTLVDTFVNAFPISSNIGRPGRCCCRCRASCRSRTYRSACRWR